MHAACRPFQEQTTDLGKSAPDIFAERHTCTIATWCLENRGRLADLQCAMAPVKTSKVTQNLSPKKSPKPQPVRIKRSDNNDKGSQKVSVAHPQKSSLKIAPQAAPVVVPCTGVYAVDIDNTVLTKLPLVSASVNTELLTNPRSAKDAVSKIMKSAENGRVLGFDMESKPRFVKGEAQQPPTVMQVCHIHTCPWVPAVKPYCFRWVCLGSFLSSFRTNKL